MPELWGGMNEIKIKNLSPHLLPQYATEGSAGMDIFAWIQEPVTLKPLERRLIHTGIYIELQPGFEAQIRPRSGLALKHGISIVNTPGTIDSDYRGEIGIVLINLSDTHVEIEDGQRIAQMVISKYEKINWVEADGLEASKRGEGGYGHTGK